MPGDIGAILGVGEVGAGVEAVPLTPSLGKSLGANLDFFGATAFLRLPSI